MAFADLLDPNTYARRDNRNYSDLVAAALKNQQAGANVQATGLENQYNQGTMDSRIAGSASHTLGEQLTNQYNEATMDPRIAEAGSKANEAASIAKEAGLKLPALEIAARQANVAGQRLSAMGVPGLDEASQSQSPNLPPSMQQATQLQAGQDGSSQSLQAGGPPQGAAATPAGQAQAAPGSPAMPAIFSHYQGMDLDQLRQAKMEDDQGGGYMKQYIDPALNMKMMGAKKEMYDALNSDEWKAKIAGLGSKNTNASQAFNEFRTKFPILSLLPETEQAKIQTESFKPNAQPSMVSVMNAPVSNTVLDNAAQRVADRKSTLSEEIAKGRWIGPKAMEMHDQLVQKVASLDPNFSEQETESGAAYAKNPKVRNSIQQLDNAYSTVGRLKDIYSKLDNGQFPTLNKAINAGKVQTGDVNAARAAIGQVLGNDELTQAFARGGTGSDKLREMSEKLSDPNASPQQMIAQFDELLQGVKRSRAAYETQGGGYIHPMKEAVGAQSSKTLPQVGAIIQHKDGTSWKFKGGPGGDPNSWEKQ